MKYNKLAALLVILSLSFALSACDSGTTKQENPETPDAAVKSSANESSVPEESESEEIYYVVIGGEDEPMSVVLVPEKAIDVVRIDNGLSLVSPLSFEETVQFYQDIIDEYQIDGQLDEVDVEALGVEQCWKFDGVHEERLFSVTVAASEDGTVGVAVIF